MAMSRSSRSRFASLMLFVMVSGSVTLTGNRRAGTCDDCAEAERQLPRGSIRMLQLESPPKMGMQRFCLLLRIGRFGLARGDRVKKGP